MARLDATSTVATSGSLHVTDRSEERRVGKEWQAGWLTGPEGAVDDTVAVTVRLAVGAGSRVPISQVMTPPAWVHPGGVVAVSFAGAEYVIWALTVAGGQVCVLLIL